MGDNLWRTTGEITDRYNAMAETGFDQNGYHAVRGRAMKANKNFGMLFVPNMYHGDRGPHAAYLVRRRWDYFMQYLLDATPPQDFAMSDQDISRGRRQRRG